MADACPGFSELISAAIDGALTPEEARTLEGHLARCAACREHDARLRSVVQTLRGAGPLLALTPEALGARLTALDARLAGDSARLAPAPDGEAVAEVETAAAPRAPSGRIVSGIAWGASAWTAVRIAAAIAFFAFALTVFQAKWAEFKQPKPVADGGRPTTTTSEVPPPPATETPRTTEPDTTTDLVPPPITTDPIPDVNPDVPPIAPDPENVPPIPPPTTSEAAPTTTEPQGDPTRQRDPSRQPGGVGPRPEVQLATRPQLEALIASILDRSTAPDQRLSQLRSLGDARFDQPLAYEFLATVVLEGTLDGHDLPNECRWAAVGALGALGSDESAQVLLLALASPPRDAHKDADDAAVCAALSALQEDAAVERLGSALAGRFADDVDRGLLALHALGSNRRAVAAVEGLLELYGKSRTPSLLREAGAVLGRTGDPRALAALVSGIEGKTSAVRQGAALGLGALAAVRPADAPACLTALKSGLARERDLGLACAVVRGLRTSGAREAIPLLIELTDQGIERRVPVRALASEALVALTGESLPHADAWRAWWRGTPGLPSPGADLKLGRPTIALQFFKLPALADGVVFVMDISGSMGQGGKWEKARAELARAIEPMTDRVRFQVIFFHHAPISVFNQGLVQATAANKQRALRALEQQRPLGVAQTAIGRALELALGWAQADTIYFVSDGADSSQDVAALRLRVARQNARRELPARIHAILLRDAQDEVLLDTNPEDPAAPFDVRLMRGLAHDSGGVFVRNGRAP